MSKNILIDTTNNIETRIAVTEDGKLDDFEIETNKKNAVKGDVYLAKITRIEPSLQAAFVDFGTNRNGFLPLTEIHPDYFKIPSADKDEVKKLYDKLNDEGILVLESATIRNRFLQNSNVVEIWYPNTYRDTSTITHLPSKGAIKSWLKMVGFSKIIDSK